MRITLRATREGVPPLSGLLARVAEHRNENARATPLDLPGATEYARCFQTIPGWFARTDLRLFDSILARQLSGGVTGDILEIGCYQGKSAILLGYGLRDGDTLTVCDLFGSEPAGVPTEGMDAYDDLTVERFTEHYARFHSRAPEVHICASSELAQRTTGRHFRFIHVDGSHAYECASGDIQTAAEHMSQRGVIVVDDYRSAHTPGVAAATWQAAAAGLIYPFCISRTKLYAAGSRDDQDWWSSYCRELGERGSSWQSEVHSVFGLELVRLQYGPR